MIYTLTLNPALDHIIRLNSLDIGETNRANNEILKAGGKGINVSKLLKNLEEDSITLGFIAGFTGFELERLVKEDFNVESNFIHVENGFTRINVKIKSSQETEINGNGPIIKQIDKERLFEKLEKLNDGDYLFMSGSIPNSLEENFYGQIMQRLQSKNISFIVDTSGQSLIESLPYNPFLIKPNLRELEGIFNTKINDEEDLKKYAKKTQELGAKNIIISLGADGAYFSGEDGKEYFLSAPKGELVDSVGSGDSMLAGFVYSIIHGNSYEDAFKFAVACGSATAFSENIASRKEIFNLYQTL